MSTRELGLAAEDFAADWLRARGYVISERNLRTPQYELDIIAMDQETLCIVEVRYTRTDAFGGPLATVSEDKKRRLRRGARAVLQKLEREVALRFDVVGVRGEPGTFSAELVQGAFWEER
jgi:putative endonuclease